MIPKIIHYCWFGGKEKPNNIKQYIAGWKKQLPDYEFIEWNEEKFTISQAPQYVKEAYEAKKYAFVSDYARIFALYNYGGVYLDTDVEIIKPFDDYLINKSLVTGFESERSLLTAFIAVEKLHPLMNEFLNSYDSRRFVMEDGTYDMTPINVGFSALLEKRGVNLDRQEYQETTGGIAVYPIAYFCGFDVSNWHIKPTHETCTIHHMNASWMNGKNKFYLNSILFLQKILGYKLYDFLKQKFRGK